mgnify:CR=1 FL=1
MKSATAPQRQTAVSSSLGQCGRCSAISSCCLTTPTGTRVCALLGSDVKGKQFSSFFAGQDRQDIEDIVGVVCEEKLAAVAGISAVAANGAKVPLELLLLPFSSRAHAPLSLTGLLTTFEDGHENLRDFTLTSWRYMGHPPQRFAPRILKKLAIARGFMVYEGLI